MIRKRIDLMSIAEFDAAFPDREACNAYLAAHRWPNGVRCPHCGSTDVRRHEDAASWRWDCRRCPDERREFSVRTGTIFANTQLSLRTWLSAVHLLLISRKVLGPEELKRLLGLNSRQTAWHVGDRIRKALGEEDFRLMIGIPKDAKVSRVVLDSRPEMAWRDGEN
jgi:transposase-like protein